MGENHLVVRPSFQVDLLPTLGQGPEQRRLAALSDADDGDTGKGPQIAVKQLLAGPLHTVHFETYALQMQIL